MFLGTNLAVCVFVSVLTVCVCVCVCARARVPLPCPVECVCVMSAITQRGSDTPLCLIPSSNPLVSRHCCREDRISLHTHQSHTSRVHTHTYTHTHTGLYLHAQQVRLHVHTTHRRGEFIANILQANCLLLSHTQLYLQPLSENTGNITHEQGLACS